MAMLSCQRLQLRATKLTRLIARPHSSRVELILTTRISDPKAILRVLQATASSLVALLLFALPAFTQEKQKTVITTPPLIKRSMAHEELIRLGYGGSVTIIGAPEGSITIEGWPRSEVALSTNI